MWKELKNVKELSSGNFGITYRGDLIIAKTYKDDVTVPVVLKVSKAETGADECKFVKIENIEEGDRQSREIVLAP